MHCISLAIFRRLSRFPAPVVGTNRPFCVDVPLKINQSVTHQFEQLRRIKLFIIDCCMIN